MKNSKYALIFFGGLALTVLAFFVKGKFNSKVVSTSQLVVQAQQTQGESQAVIDYELPQQPTNTRILSVGEVAPDFSVTSIDGKRLVLSELRGKTIVMTSSAAWCPTCITENKYFKFVFEEVKDKEVEFITVDIDFLDTEKMIRGFQEKHAPWNNIHLSQAKTLIEDYAFWFFEITYIIDENGVIQFTDTGITSTDTLREELSKLI